MVIILNSRLHYALYQSWVWNIWSDEWFSSFSLNAGTLIHQENKKMFGHKKNTEMMFGIHQLRGYRFLSWP